MRTTIDSKHDAISVIMKDELAISNMRAPLSMNGLWSKSTPGKITMYRGDSRNQHTYSAYDFRRVAAHEFGHILGVEDYYIYVQPENSVYRADADPNKPSVFNLQWEQAPVVSGDVEKVLTAFLTNKWQKWF
jgi:predicted Zn-dependent protease